jgi:hypothetical protein
MDEIEGQIHNMISPVKDVKDAFSKQGVRCSESGHVKDSRTRLPGLLSGIVASASQKRVLRVSLSCRRVGGGQESLGRCMSENLRRIDLSSTARDSKR